MTMKAAKKMLVSVEPLMKCGNRDEFQQRLQWLSEGMLRNHLEGVINYTPDPVEIALYHRYKDAVGKEVK